MGEDLYDQSHRAQAVELGPLICLSASIQNQEIQQVWGQMSPQWILSAKLWLGKARVNWKAVCVLFCVFWSFFLIKTTHPPVLTTHRFVPCHSSCLYHYYRAAPRPPYPVLLGETEITKRRNPHLSSSPHLKLPHYHCDTATTWSPWGLREQGSALSLFVQPGLCWWPHTSAVPRCEAFSASSNSLTSTAQVLSSAQSTLLQQCITPGGTST